MPVRVQRKRTKGFKMLPNAVYVGRPTKFGNRFAVAPLRDLEGHYADYTKNVDLWDKWPCKNAATAVDAFRKMQIPSLDLSELRGKDLACWCHLCDKHKDGKPMDVDCPDCAPCHVDVLLTISNAVVQP